MATSFSVPRISATPVEELPNADKILSDERWMQFITDLEYTYWEKGSYLTTQDMSELYRITLDEAESLFLKANPVLEKRGLPPTTRRTLFPDKFDPMFILAVNKLSDPLDKRSNAVKLKDLGLSTKAFQAYLKLENNRSYYERRLNEAFETTEYSAKTSLMRNIESGDLNSIKYFHEYTGRFQSNDSTAFNFIVVLQKVMEILARHVDQNVLDVVAAEFENTLQ
jgi:hypothetical protein